MVLHNEHFRDYFISVDDEAIGKELFLLLSFALKVKGIKEGGSSRAVVQLYLYHVFG